MAFTVYLLVSICVAAVAGSSPTESNLPHISYGDGLSSVGNHNLLDIVLVASVDGKFHGLNRTDGRTIWSMSANPSLTSISAPSSLSPLIKTSLADVDNTDEPTKSQEVYVVDPQSGDLYVRSTPSGPLKPFPFSMIQLVEMSPFSFSASGDGRPAPVFLGTKEISLLVLELETGKIKASYTSECLFDSNQSASGEDQGILYPISHPREVFIGRSDYHLSIHTQPFGRKPGDPEMVVQNPTYSVYGPDEHHSASQTTYQRAEDDAYIQSFPNGDIMAFKARLNEGDMKADSQPLWARSFTSPIVAIFNVWQEPNSARAYVQPSSVN